MQTSSNNSSQVRVTLQAREHLEKLIPAIRARRGLNVSMTDIVSELILSAPLPTNTPAAVTRKRTRKAAPAQ